MVYDEETFRTFDMICVCVLAVCSYWRACNFYAITGLLVLISLVSCHFVCSRLLKWGIAKCMRSLVLRSSGSALDLLVVVDSSLSRLLSFLPLVSRFR